MGKLSEEDVEHILKRVKNERPSALAKEFQVSPATIYAIKSGKIHKDVPGDRIDPRGRISEDQAKAVLELWREGRSAQDISDTLEINIQTVYNVSRGRTFKALDRDGVVKRTGGRAAVLIEEAKKLLSLGLTPKQAKEKLGCSFSPVYKARAILQEEELE